MDPVDGDPKGRTPLAVQLRVAGGDGLPPGGGRRSVAGEPALLRMLGGVLGSERLSLGRAQACFVRSCGCGGWVTGLSRHREAQEGSNGDAQRRTPTASWAKRRHSRSPLWLGSAQMASIFFPLGLAWNYY